MTLIVALKCDDGLIIASDGRIVTDGEYHEAKKIFKLGRTLLMGAAGTTGVIQKVIEKLSGATGSLANPTDRLAIEDRIYEVYVRHARMYKDLDSKFEDRFGGDMLICDAENMYRFLMDGYSEPSSEYECIGSARPYGLSILRDFYQPNLDLGRGKELAVYVVLQAIQISRDVGPPIQIAETPKDKEARILSEKEVNDIVDRINGRQKVLRMIWEALSERPELKDEIQSLISKKEIAKG